MNNNIKYLLTYGSLLGAVRDDGFITWDFDIDVFVLFDERRHLLEVLKKELDPAFGIHSLETNPRCESFKIRIFPKGKDPLLHHLDLFSWLLLLTAKRNSGNALKKSKK